MMDTAGCEHGDAYAAQDMIGRTFCRECRRTQRRVCGPTNRNGDGSRAVVRTASVLDSEKPTRPPQQGIVGDRCGARFYTGTPWHPGVLLPEPDPTPPPALSPLFGQGLELPSRDQLLGKTAPASVDAVRLCNAGVHEMLAGTSGRCMPCKAAYHQEWSRRKRAGAQDG